MAFQDYSPLLVRVDDNGRWDAIPASDLGYSVRERWIIQEIKFKGGIDETTKPGYYKVNVVLTRFGEKIEMLPAMVDSREKPLL